MTSRRLTISRAATLITIVTMAWQVNLPLELPQYDAASLPFPYLAPAVSLGEITACVAIAAYALAGWPNHAMLRSRWRRVFALSLVGLILFEALSTAWSIQRGLAVMQVLHTAVWASFALLIACADWPATAMTSAFLIGLLLHSFVGFVQIGWQPLVQITPQNSGISVVFNNAQHLQRIYGLSPHPNLLGGHLAIGVILAAGFIMIEQHTRRRRLMAAWVIIWIALLLTFSRSAWLAAIGGSAAAVMLLIRGGHLTQFRIKLIARLSGAGLIVILVFFVIFQPFLVNRFDVTVVSYEMQAIAERVSTARLAWQIFVAHPATGVGISQSIVVMRDLAGMPIDWVHNVPLLAAAELGVGGSALIATMVIALGAIGAQRWRARSIVQWQALVGGGLIALIIVMQFDHYVWTSAQGGLLWAWLVGLWLRTESVRRVESPQSHGMLRN